MSTLRLLPRSFFWGGRVESYPTVPLGNGAHLSHDRHLLDLQRHDPFTVIERLDRREVEDVAVALELHDLRSEVLLPLVPLGARQLRQMRRRLLALKPSGYRAAEQLRGAGDRNATLQ